MNICFASHNQHKINELNQMLAGTYQVIGLDELGITEDIPETGNTFKENSRIKARYVFDRHKIPVFADDSGLCVNALNGAPGVFSARYAGPEKSDEKNNELLLKNLSEIQDRKAKFVCVITFISEDGEETQFSGEVSGTIRNERIGHEGFGYDPIFEPDGYQKTFAEFSNEEKNEISHRAIAVKSLIKHLKTNG